MGAGGVDPEVVASFRERGWALTRSLDADGVARLRAWVDEVASWPDDGGDWMHHRELTDAGPALCRSENLIPHHAGLRELLTEGAMPDVAGALLGEPAVLYKEKVNYKLPGGAGYAPHQDAPAYPFIDQHVSCMVAVDDATLENGCLEVVTGAHHRGAPDRRHRLHPGRRGGSHGVARRGGAGGRHPLVPLAHPAPQWTQPLRGPRRALYPTYNARSEGDLRAAYYDEKRARFAAGRAATGANRVQVSLIGDFQGREV